MWQLQVRIRTFYDLFGFRTVIPRRGESSASSSPNSVPTLSVKRGFVQGSRLGLRVSQRPKKCLAEFALLEGRVLPARRARFWSYARCSWQTSDFQGSLKSGTCDKRRTSDAFSSVWQAVAGAVFGGLPSFF